MEQQSARGIDVEKKRLDIRLIVLRHFSVAGVPAEDLVQEVMLGILHRNRLPNSAYDPARGAFGTYVYMVGQNVAARLGRAETRQQRVRAALAEQLDVHVAGLNGWPIAAAQAGEPISMPRRRRARRPRRRPPGLRPESG